MSTIQELHDSFDHSHMPSITDKNNKMKFKVYIDLYEGTNLDSGDETWARWLEKNSPVLCPKNENCFERTKLLNAHFASISRAMSQVEIVEQQEGELFDIVVRLREDSYALDEWKLSPSYSKGFTGLDFLNFGGISDLTYTASREYASDLFHGLRNLRRPENLEKLPEEYRVPQNTETWLSNVVSFLNIPRRLVSICEMPVLPSRWVNGQPKLKSHIGFHLYMYTLGLPQQLVGRLMLTSINLTSNSYQTTNLMHKDDPTETYREISCKPKWLKEGTKMLEAWWMLRELEREDGWYECNKLQAKVAKGRDKDVRGVVDAEGAREGRW
eukprot:CAMPEP_0174275312 /NCGR_PEP_ID=MMETSP0439-20130205/59755_1 /TAXON_ID=0 /ORGANISM="Stereomyxa ramosa, Strain Chinc5" /LENGTH=326 /DNA_ID=CAMNT_0015367403 /DNA_START=323 /DNA_END=1300 /DNA_ORIENTATION=-